MVVSIIAVIAACTGTAFAAASITSKDVVNDSLRSNDIKDRSLKSHDISRRTKKQLRGHRGPTGPRGATGPAGPRGEPGKDVGPTEFGVARLYRNDTAANASWSGDVPDDGNNAAQVAGTTVLPCETGDVFSLQAVYRTDEEDGGEAGAGLVITSQGGDLLAAGQTAESAEHPGRFVVDVPAVPKTSGEPTGGDDTELVSVTIPNGVPAGTQCVVSGTGQFFDFDDSAGTEG
jgi:hypothetical protein